jgi:hypothetical protein
MITPFNNPGLPNPPTTPTRPPQRYPSATVKPLTIRKKSVPLSRVRVDALAARMDVPPKISRYAQPQKSWEQLATEFGERDLNGLSLDEIRRIDETRRRAPRPTPSSTNVRTTNAYNKYGGVGGTEDVLEAHTRLIEESIQATYTQRMVQKEVDAEMVIQIVDEYESQPSEKMPVEQDGEMLGMRERRDSAVSLPERISEKSPVLPELDLEHGALWV